MAPQELGTAIIIGTAACALIAQRMAIRRGRPTRYWMLAAALLGPLPLAVLAFFPVRRTQYI